MSLLERFRMEREQAAILARELERARREGNNAPLPGAEERLQRESRHWPRLPREEAIRLFNERAAHAVERERARASRQQARARGALIEGRFGIADVIARDGEDCYLCGSRPAVADRQLEHVIPISLGGTHSFENAALACRRCNLYKAALIVAFRVATRRPHYVRPR